MAFEPSQEFCEIFKRERTMNRPSPGITCRKSAWCLCVCFSVWIFSLFAACSDSEKPDPFTEARQAVAEVSADSTAMRYSRRRVESARMYLMQAESLLTAGNTEAALQSAVRATVEARTAQVAGEIGRSQSLFTEPDSL